MKPTNNDSATEAYLEHVEQQKFIDILADGRALRLRRGYIGRPCLVYHATFELASTCQQNAARIAESFRNKNYVELKKPTLPIIEGSVAAELFTDAQSAHPVHRRWLAMHNATEAYATQRLRVLHFPHGLNYDGDLEFEEMADTDLYVGAIIEGDVRVSGILSQLTYAYPSAILVTGSVHAFSFGQADSHFIIEGDLHVQQTIYGHYNDGELAVKGAAHGEVWISCDHGMYANTYHLPQFSERELANAELLHPDLLVLGDGDDEPPTAMDSDLVYTRFAARQTLLRDPQDGPPAWLTPKAVDTRPPIRVFTDIESLDALLKLPGVRLVPLKTITPKLPALKGPVPQLLKQLLARLNGEAGAKALVLPADFTLPCGIMPDVFRQAGGWRGISLFYGEGSVRLAGDLVDDHEAFPLFFIEGDLHLRSWCHGGKMTFIGGDLHASGCIVGEYNDGPMFVGGDLHAPGGYFRRIKPYPDLPNIFPHQVFGKTHAPLFDLYDLAIDEAWIKSRIVPEVLGKALGGSAPKPLVDAKSGEFWYEADRLIAHCARGLAVWKTLD